MNINSITSPALAGVFPQIAVSIRVSTGATEDATGREVPGYAPAVTAMGRRQSLSSGEILRLNQQNIQGVDCKLYLNGNYEGQFRVLGRGGDLIDFGGQTYFVASVLERWPDWCSLALTMLNGVTQ